MIFWFIEFLENVLGLHVPSAFEYTSTRMALSALTSLLLAIFLGKPVIKKLYELRIGQKIRYEDCPLLGELHRKKNDTPTMGGLLILISMLVSLLLWMNLKSLNTWILLATTLFLGWVGGYDDFLKLKMGKRQGLSGKKKFILQAFFGALLGIYLVSPLSGEYYNFLYFPFFKDPILEFRGIFVIILVLFFVVVIAGTSNAVNLTDGLDGLACGNLIMVSSSLALVAFVSNHMPIAHYLNIPYLEEAGEIAVYLSALGGGCLGFLWYNSHPAQIFMGDTGSIPLGGILGVSAILLRREVLLAILGGVFVLEALSVILQVGSYRYRNKRRVFLCAPLHHHFEYRGWPETKVVARFWIAGFIFALGGLISLKLQ